MKESIAYEIYRYHHTKWYRVSDYLWLLRLVFLQPKTLSLILKKEFETHLPTTIPNSLYRLLKLPQLLHLFLGHLFFGGCFIFVLSSLLSLHYYLEKVPLGITWEQSLFLGSFILKLSAFTTILYMGSSTIILWSLIGSVLLWKRALSKSVFTGLYLSINFYLLHLAFLFFTLDVLTVQRIDLFTLCLIIAFLSTFFSNLIWHLILIEEKRIDNKKVIFILLLFISISFGLVGASLPGVKWPWVWVPFTVAFLCCLQLPWWLLIQVAIWKSGKAIKSPLFWWETSLLPEMFLAERLLQRLQNELDEESLFWVLSSSMQQWAVRKSIILLWDKTPKKTKQLFKLLEHSELWTAPFQQDHGWTQNSKYYCWFHLLLLELVATNHQSERTQEKKERMNRLRQFTNLYPICPPELEKLARGYLQSFETIASTNYS